MAEAEDTEDPLSYELPRNPLRRSRAVPALALENQNGYGSWETFQLNYSTEGTFQDGAEEAGFNGHVVPNNSFSDTLELIPEESFEEDWSTSGQLGSPLPFGLAVIPEETTPEMSPNKSEGSIVEAERTSTPQGNAPVPNPPIAHSAITASSTLLQDPGEKVQEEDLNMSSSTWQTLDSDSELLDMSIEAVLQTLQQGLLNEPPVGLSIFKTFTAKGFTNIVSQAAASLNVICLQTSELLDRMFKLLNWVINIYLKNASMSHQTLVRILEYEERGFDQYLIKQLQDGAKSEDHLFTISVAVTLNTLLMHETILVNRYSPSRVKIEKVKKLSGNIRTHLHNVVIEYRSLLHDRVQRVASLNITVERLTDNKGNRRNKVVVCWPDPVTSHQQVSVNYYNLKTTAEEIAKQQIGPTIVGMSQYISELTAAFLHRTKLIPTVIKPWVKVARNPYPGICIGPPQAAVNSGSPEREEQSANSSFLILGPNDDSSDILSRAYAADSSSQRQRCEEERRILATIEARLELSLDRMEWASEGPPSPSPYEAE